MTRWRRKRGCLGRARVVDALTMKPTAPSLSLTDEAPESSLESEIARVCETKARDERITIPAPPSPETLKAATPCPPAREESDLPGAPRVPKIHSM
jgi:hypothetical protein